MYDSIDPNLRFNYGILEIQQVRIFLPNVSQARADQLSKDLNLEIRRIVDAFARALSNG